MSSSIGKSRFDELIVRSGLGGARRSVVITVALLCVVIAALAVYRWWPQAAGQDQMGFSISQTHEAASGSNDAGSDRSPPNSAPSAEETVVVHVAGAVMRPGVVYLPSGSRVQGAINAAGGFLGSAAQDALNLARVITDGEQIYVPTSDEVKSGALAGKVGVPQAQQPTNALVDLNSADAELLDTLPGVGPATAQRIIADREKNGSFLAPEDLKRVPGIGEKKFEALADLVVAN